MLEYASPVSARALLCLKVPRLYPLFLLIMLVLKQIRELSMSETILTSKTPKYSERNLSKSDVVNNKSHTKWRGIQFGCQRKGDGAH